MGLILGFAIPGFSMVVRMDLPRLIQASDLIVQGRVTGIQTRWIADSTGSNIWTFVTVNGGLPLKGTVETTPLMLKILGGTVGDITQEVSDTPRFSAGEDVCLFLEGNPLQVVGGFQGRLSIRDGKVRTNGLNVDTGVFARAVRAYVDDPSTDLYGLLLAVPPTVYPGTSPPAGPAANVPSAASAPATGGARTLTATISIVQWLNEVDYNNNGYKEYAELYWDPDVKGGAGSLSVFEKVYWRLNGTTPWSLLVTMPTHTITGTSVTDAQTLKLNGGEHNGYDFRIEIYEAGAASPDAVADPTTDPYDLQNYLMETPDEDAGGSGPVIMDMEPAAASAGTGTQMYIRGLGFGNSQGSGTIQFYFAPGEVIPVSKSAITQWTDKAILCTVPSGTVQGYSGSAGSGPVTITTDAGQSAQYNPFIVTFGYNRAKWPGTDPEVDFYVGTNITDWTDTLTNAGNQWNAAAFVRITYAGTTTNTAPSRNNMNEVMFSPLPSGIIGEASYWMQGGVMLEADLVLSSTLKWSTNAVTPPGAFDVGTICLHEMGHWMSLTDLYGNIQDGYNDIGKVMYGYRDAGQGGQLRVLTQADADGVSWIYGAPAPPRADFTWFTGYTVIGQPVAFMDESTLTPTAWLWDFGDGSTSTQQNPTHSFPFSGTFTVTLTATNAFGSGAVGKSIIIEGIGEVPPLTASQPYTYVIPATAKAAGVNNTNWLTDMMVFNPGGTAVNAYAYYLEAEQDNSAARGVEMGLGGSKFVKISDLVSRMFGLANTSGALLLASPQPLEITSRTYNDQGSAGTFGQFIPAFPLADVLTDTRNGTLLHLSKTSHFRTNIGGVNLLGAPLTLSVALYAEDGTLIGTAPYTLKPYEQFQTSAFIDQFTSQDVNDAYAVASSSTAGARFTVYASVVDNITGDPMFVPPQKTADVLNQTHQIIATVARAKGGFGSNWRSDLRLFNPFSAQTVTLTLVTGNGTFSATVHMGASRLVAENDVITTLFPGAAGDTAGSLQIQSDQGIMATSRTYNDQGAAGTYGQFIPLRSAPGLTVSGATWQVLQLAANADFRCNIGFSDYGGGGAQVQVKIYDVNHSILAFKTYSIPPSGNTQISSIFQDMGITAEQDSSMADIKVLSDGPVYGYASVVDNRSNDAIFVPAQQ